MKTMNFFCTVKHCVMAESVELSTQTALHHVKCKALSV